MSNQLNRTKKCEIWVAGYPGRYGGADTELDHLIDLWLGHGVDVHLVPNGEPNPVMWDDVSVRGAVTHRYRPDIFADKLVVSFCNAGFLERLEEICAHGRPRCVVWANCMTWTFPAELECHRRGLIDLHVFQSAYQRHWLLPELQALRPVQELAGYRPFFQLERWAPPPRCPPPRQSGYFGIGRISRDDAGKYPADLWRTMSRITAPQPVKCFVLGWGENAQGKCGRPDGYPLDWMLWAPAAVTAQSLLARVHALVHQTGGSRENAPRVALEAWASGVVVLAERNFGWPELIDDGQTGILCDGADEFVYRASQLAFDDERRRRIVAAAHDRLRAVHCDPHAAFTPWARIL
jgi:Glycosyl transferases group 1